MAPCPSTAVFFADQMKAFERVSMQWAAQVLEAWGMPLWVRRSLLALCQQRSVQTIRGKFKGKLRKLQRSVGMGGTASPLLWCIAYDPVVDLASRVAATDCPTYVDDLAALLEDAAQTLRLAFVLPWASHALGLKVATHSCRCLLYTSPSPRDAS